METRCSVLVLWETPAVQHTNRSSAPHVPCTGSLLQLRQVGAMFTLVYVKDNLNVGLTSLHGLQKEPRLGQWSAWLFNLLNLEFYAGVYSCLCSSKLPISVRLLLPPANGDSIASLPPRTAVSALEMYLVGVLFHQCSSTICCCVRCCAMLWDVAYNALRAATALRRHAAAGIGTLDEQIQS